MRQVHLLKVTPCLATLSDRHVRVAVDDVLELVDEDAVREERDASCQMIELVFVDLIAEEQFHPWPAEELHRHRVDLTRLVSRERVFRRRQMTALVHLEGVTDLVREHVDIAGRPVEVREDERQTFRREVRAVTAAGLARFRRQVEGAALLHELEELVRLF